MAANLGLLTVAVLSLFGVFILGLGYAQWSTKDVVLVPAADRKPRD